MTTHENTKGQYRRAPVNGLIIGTIIGVAWVFVLLIPGLFTNDPSRRARMDLVALVLPILGLITGAWERSFTSRRYSAQIEHRIKVICAAMMTAIGIIMAVTFYTLVASQHTLHAPARAAYSTKAFILYLLPLMMFPCAGWALGGVRANNIHDARWIISKMSIMAGVMLFLSVAFWFTTSLLIEVLFFFRILSVFLITHPLQQPTPTTTK
ncbi:hypothetical protein [Cutibacterium porci]|uniref:hypothetical protein n=1 Tax=Cutibacterium porci TaxID=2605781 RepID=UPI001E5E5A0C|nr:hypothetical protein [Cutibacterium porci]